MRQPTAWERRAELGWAQGLFQTWKQTLLKPDAFWSSVEPRGHVGDAVLYAWILVAARTLIALPFALLGAGRAQLDQALAQLQVQPPEWMNALLTELMKPRTALALAAVGVLLTPVTLALWAAFLQVSCWICGVSRQGFPATVRVVAYASAPLVFALPGIGLLAGVYQLVLIILGLHRVQETTQTRAVLAVVLPVVLFGCVFCGAGVVLLVKFVGSQIG